MVIKEDKYGFNRSRYAQLKFNYHKRKQSVFYNIVKDLFDGKKALVFATPSPICAGSRMKGHRRAPLMLYNKALQLYPGIDVIYIDEYRTTMLCNKCAKKVFKSKRFVICVNCKNDNDVLDEPKNGAEASTLNGLQIDVTIQITTITGRDARNILRLGLEYVGDLERNERFIRKKIGY